MDVGIIGLGLLGSALAERLIAEGWVVHGYDLRPEACAAAQVLGVRVQPTASEAAAHAQVVLLSLMTSQDRRALLWGDQRLADALLEDAILLDTTTGDPTHTLEDHEKLKQSGITLVDLCIAGSSEEVRQHQALALIGANRSEAARWQSLVEALSRAQFYFGHAGNGNQAKLIFNTVIGLHRLVLAEALGLAKKSGFDLQEMLELLKAGGACSAVMESKGPKMAGENFEPPVARLAQHAKDVDLILDFAQSVGADMPVSRLHRSLLAELEAAGAGSLDNAAIFKYFA